MKDSISDQSPSTVSSNPEPTATTATDQAAVELKSGVLADAHDLTDTAKQVAGGVISHARASASDQISSGKNRVADSLGSVADAIRHTGEHLRSNDSTSLTEYAARAAEQVEAASDYLKESSLSDVVEDIADFARREPAMFLGGAFVLGVVGGRFLKSSHAQTNTNNGSPKPLASVAREYQSPTPREASSRRDYGGAQATRKSAASFARGTGAKRGSQPNQEGRGSNLPASGTDAPRANGDGAKLPGAV